MGADFLSSPFDPFSVKDLRGIAMLLLLVLLVFFSKTSAVFIEVEEDYKG